MRRVLVGSLTGVASAAALAAAMLPARAHLNVATDALVLVIPVVAAVAVGGFAAGAVGVAAGFLLYDLVFIPPYYTLSVGAAQNWTALGVYAAVMLLVARVVSRLDEARAAARRSATDAQRLFALADLLVQDRSLDELLSAIVSILTDAFSLDSVAVLLPEGSGLQIGASAGEPVDPAVVARLGAHPAGPVEMHPAGVDGAAVHTVALVASGRPVGVLLIRGAPATPAGWELLRTFANHAAVALERSRLRDQAVRAELLEEVDRLRRALVGAVSHDLRTPLATIKVATTTMLESGSELPPADTQELLELTDMQTDRLTRLVNNLLDMTRIQAGALEVHKQTSSVTDLVNDAVRMTPTGTRDVAVTAHLTEGLPSVNADPVLVGEVLANLIDNAARHAPEGSEVLVEAVVDDGYVQLAVEDSGPGVPAAERHAVFDSFVRFDTGGRSGLGLSIAKAFVEAHGGRIWVDSGRDEGARFIFTLPLACGDRQEQ